MGARPTVETRLDIAGWCQQTILFFMNFAGRQSVKLVANGMEALRLEDLAAFVATADSGSLSQAALLRGCSQSMLSRRVLELERVVGGRLFNRTGRGVVLTELGTALLPEARALLYGAKDFMEHASSTRHQPAGTVEVALPHWAASGSVSALINRVGAQFPRIRLVIHESYSTDVVDRLASGKLDIGVYNSKHAQPPAGAQLLFSSELLLIGRRGAPLVSSGTVQLAALRHASIVTPPVPNPIQAVLRDVAAGLDLDLQIDHEINSGAMARDVVRHSGRYSISMLVGLAERLTAENLAAARIVNPSLVLYTYCATGAKHRLSDATRAVERHLIDIMREQYAEAMALMAAREGRSPATSLPSSPAPRIVHS